MTAPVLEARGVSVVFRGRRRGLTGPPARIRAVEDVTLAVRGGETLALVGESGSGKTTLGRTLAHLQTATSGEVRLDGAPADPALLRRRVQVIFQDPFSALNPRLTVRRLLEEPLIVHRLGTPGERTRRVEELLDLVGLPRSHQERYPHEFSGGQRQRIAVARALAIGPEILLADEPLSALDVSIQAQIVNLLGELKAALGLTLVLISHDLSVVGHVADRVAVMHLGRVVETGAVAQVFAQPRHPYTRALLAAAPLPDPARRGRIVPGADDDAPAPPDGCRYRARCPWAADICARLPALEGAGEGREVACHRWRELPAPDSPVAFDPPYRLRLEAYARRRAAALSARAAPREAGADRPPPVAVQQGDPA